MLLLVITDTKRDLGTVTIAGSQHQQPKWDLKLASSQTYECTKKFHVSHFLHFKIKKFSVFKLKKHTFKMLFGTFTNKKLNKSLGKSSNFSCYCW